jgi:hypothetical protein
MMAELSEQSIAIIGIAWGVSVILSYFIGYLFGGKYVIKELRKK